MLRDAEAMGYWLATTARWRHCPCAFEVSRVVLSSRVGLVQAAADLLGWQRAAAAAVGLEGGP